MKVSLTLLFVLQLNLGTLRWDDILILTTGLDDAMGLDTGYFFVFTYAWSQVNLVLLVSA